MGTGASVNLIKEVNLGAEFQLDSLIADCFNNFEQETCNKMPAASVYLLGNLHFLQFFVADS